MARAAACVLPPLRSGTTANGVYFEVHGSGTPLFLGFPLMASHAAVFGAEAGAVRDRFLAGLVDRYSVLLADYPSIGRSATIPPAQLTLDRVCADMLAVADAAGFTRFAWWGATFGAVTGMTLAARSERVTALLSAGWSPLGTPYPAMVEAARAQSHDPPAHARVVLRDLAQYAQWGTFYSSLGTGWEEGTVPQIRCARAVIYGEQAESSVGDCPLPIAATVRARRAELIRLGWRVVELPGADASLVLQPDSLVPAARSFFDSVLSVS